MITILAGSSGGIVEIAGMGILGLAGIIWCGKIGTRQQEHPTQQTEHPRSKGAPGGAVPFESVEAPRLASREVAVTEVARILWRSHPAMIERTLESLQETEKEWVESR